MARPFRQRSSARPGTSERTPWGVCSRRGSRSAAGSRPCSTVRAAPTSAAVDVRAVRALSMRLPAAARLPGLVPPARSRCRGEPCRPRVGGRMRALRNPFASLPPEVAVLTAVAFSVALGFGVVAPAIPLFAREFGVSNFAAGAVVSVFALVRFASAPGGRPAGQPPRRAVGAGHRYRHRRGLEPAGRVCRQLHPAARAARRRRLRLGDVHRVVVRAAAARRRPRPARPGGRHVPDRVPAGRHRRSRLRWPADGLVPARAVLRLRRRPCWSPGEWPSCSSPARTCASTRSPRAPRTWPRPGSRRRCAARRTGRPWPTTSRSAGRSSGSGRRSSRCSSSRGCTSARPGPGPGWSCPRWFRRSCSSLPVGWPTPAAVGRSCARGPPWR